MNEKIIGRRAVDGKESCQLTAQMLVAQGAVDLDGDAARELDWAFGEAAALKWRRSSAESGQCEAPPVVTVKRRRVLVP